MRPVPPEASPEYSNYIKNEEQNGTQELILESPVVDSCEKDEWWREAIVAADKVENMPRMLDLGKEASVFALNVYLSVEWIIG